MEKNDDIDVDNVIDVKKKIGNELNCILKKI
jgi:hypothetical protein